tara:strand:+ start:925 stop:1173 length:249 start_codon:yes stop_codon:yes gene_type:complete
LIVVLGICHTCSEYTPLVKQDIRDKLVYKCFHCHSQYEQMINGKILFQFIDEPEELEKEAQKIVKKLKEKEEELEIDVELED